MITCKILTSPSRNRPQINSINLQEYTVNMQKSGAFLYTIFPSGTSGKEHSCQCRRHKRLGVRPLGLRAPGGGHGNPLLYSCSENPIDRGVRQATVHRISESDMTEAT